MRYRVAVTRAHDADTHERETRTDSGGLVFVRRAAVEPKRCELHPDELEETCPICTHTEVRRG